MCVAIMIWIGTISSSVRQSPVDDISFQDLVSELSKDDLVSFVFSKSLINQKVHSMVPFPKMIISTQ